MSELKGCVLVAASGPGGCCAALAGLVGQVVPGCSEDLSCGSPHCGAGSGSVAWAHRQGQSLSHLQPCSPFQEMGIALSFPVQRHRGFCFPPDSHLVGKPRVPCRHRTCGVLQGNTAILEKQKHVQLHPTAGKEQSARALRLWWEVMGCIPASQHESHRTWPTEGVWERLGVLNS